MATYSLLFIDANEHIGRSRQIECPTDQQAVDRAAKEPGVTGPFRFGTETGLSL
jgi:hypothetical protein